MVLEAIISSKEMLRHPLFMLFISIVIGSASIWIAFFTFPGSSSILSIAFITIALVPMMDRVFIREEESEARKPGYAASFLARHFRVIEVFAWFFIGLIITYAFWYAVLPSEQRQIVFSEQEKTLSSIGNLRETLTGSAVIQARACGSNSWCWFDVIFFNNSFVLLAAITLSFVYGAGAIFLIGWNASIVGVLLGREIISVAGPAGALHGLASAANVSLALLPHGIPEWLGYFVGAIAGGIISAAITKRRYRRHEPQTISKDVTVMLFYAVGLLLIGALIEAWAIVSSI